MPTLLLTEQPDSGYVISRQSRVRERLVARMRSFELDAALARGASPDSSAALSLRAHELISRRTRRRLSKRIHCLLREARRPPSPLSPGVPICRRKVLTASVELENLAERLTAPGPVDVRGVAQVELLLRDGSSALYGGPHRSDLHRAVRAAMSLLMIDR